MQLLASVRNNKSQASFAKIRKPSGDGLLERNVAKLTADAVIPFIKSGSVQKPRGTSRVAFNWEVLQPCRSSLPPAQHAPQDREAALFLIIDNLKAFIVSEMQIRLEGASVFADRRQEASLLAGQICCFDRGADVDLWCSLSVVESLGCRRICFIFTLFIGSVNTVIDAI
uniref:Uncharacterized protein n=1 Tax=Steinernema glaseri TaxID=37863 RepID=A0A1I7ZYW2_9BILA